MCDEKTRQSVLNCSRIVRTELLGEYYTQTIQICKTPELMSHTISWYKTLCLKWEKQISMTLYNKTKQNNVPLTKPFLELPLLSARDAKVQHQRNLWSIENEGDKSDRNVFASVRMLRSIPVGSVLFLVDARWRWPGVTSLLFDFPRGQEDCPEVSGVRGQVDFRVGVQVLDLQSVIGLQVSHTWNSPEDR